MTATEIVADIPQPVTAPSSPRGTRETSAPSVAITITITAAAGRRFRIMQMSHSSDYCNGNLIRRYRYVHASAQRGNEEFMVSAINGSEIRHLRVLVVGRSEGHCE